MSLFGSTPAATSTTPLFGTTAAKPAGGGLFGSSSTAPATSSVPLFGSTTTSSPAAAAGSGGLFGSKPAATTSGGLFGSTTTTAAAAPSGGLFGASTTPAATTGGGLFGSTTSTTAPATGGGLFGASKPASTTLGGGLFGASAPAATTSFGTAPGGNTTLGLGGVQQQTNTGATVTTGTAATTSAPGASDKDATKENECQQTQSLIRDMLPLIEDRLRKNRDLMEESETMTVDSAAIEEMIEKARGLIGDVRRDVFNTTTSSESVAQLVAHDKAQANMAKRVQEQASTANQTMHADLIKRHLVERIQLYDLEMKALQERVNFMRSRFDKLLKGEPSLTMSELDQYFLRCDSTVSSADFHIEQLGREIEELRDHLIEKGYTQLRKWNNTINSVDAVSGVSEGAEFFPSQSSLAIIGSALRAPAQATATTTTGGLGLGGGTSLFGNTGSTSLFGSTAPKPAFSGGSLFGSTTTSTAPATGTTATSLFGSKPATSSTTTTTTPFASTVANNSSGVLFSSRK